MLIIGCDFHTRYQQIAMLGEALVHHRSALPVRLLLEFTTYIYLGPPHPA